MSATNLTKNLKLSQFVASDRPSWLGDVNGDNKKIDDGYGVLAGEISKANDTASSAKSQSDANTQTLTNVNSELEDYGNRITALESGGGTEQLEQRVNTLGTDVEALQTRANTFEENITQNGTDITNLKNKVATIEPKVKANEDGIKRVDAVVNGLSESVQSNSNSVNSLQTRLSTTESNVRALQASSGISIIATNNFTLGTSSQSNNVLKVSKLSSSKILVELSLVNTGSQIILDSSSWASIDLTTLNLNLSANKTESVSALVINNGNSQHKPLIFTAYIDSTTKMLKLTPTPSETVVFSSSSVLTLSFIMTL